MRHKYKFKPNVKYYILSEEKFFKINARLILELGRNSIREHTTALAELVKNSYDADAKNVTVDIYTDCEDPYIRVADNGFGMTEKIVDENWLTIGFSEKKIKRTSKEGRAKAGSKGIGRIAADRLGSVLRITTKAVDDKIQGLYLDWEKFNTDEDVSNVPINVIEDPNLNVPHINRKASRTGTEIIISRLRQSWTEDDVRKLYRELSILISPFHNKHDFRIKLNSDVSSEYYDKDIVSSFSDVAEIEVELSYDGKGESLDYYIHDKGVVKPILRAVPINQLIHKSNPNSSRDKLDCGPFTLKLLFFLRSISKSTLKKFDFANQSAFREMLDDHLGVKIYRDNIVVKPYGFPGDVFGDWLKLGARKASDPAGVARKTYKVSPNQIMGCINITEKENSMLQSVAGRDGLLDNNSFQDLKLLVFRGIEILEAYRHKQTIKEEKKEIKGKSREGLFRKVSHNLNSIGYDIEKISKNIAEGKTNNKQASDLLLGAAKKIEEETDIIEDLFQEMLNEKRVLNGLATLGITTAVMGHETQSMIGNLNIAAKNAKKLLSKNKMKMGLQELEKALGYTKTLEAWGKFSLARIAMEKRINPKAQPVDTLIKHCVSELQAGLNASTITVDTSEIERVITKVYPMDIETIIFNLLTNALKACVQIHRERKIKVILKNFTKSKKKGYQIMIVDTGNGIADEFIEKIWEPLFSTVITSRGARSTGLGLSIVKSVVIEMGGTIKVKPRDNVYGGAKFIIWLPKVS